MAATGPPIPDAYYMLSALAGHDEPDIIYWHCFDCGERHYITAARTDRPESCKMPFTLEKRDAQRK